MKHLAGFLSLALFLGTVNPAGACTIVMVARGQDRPRRQQRRLEKPQHQDLVHPFIERGIWKSLCRVRRPVCPGRHERPRPVHRRQRPRPHRLGTRRRQTHLRGGTPGQHTRQVRHGRGRHRLLQPIQHPRPVRGALPHRRQDRSIRRRRVRTGQSAVCEEDGRLPDSDELRDHQREGRKLSLHKIQGRRQDA